MKVLITNATLASRTGTEVYVKDLAVGLLKRGHTPIVYSTRHGEIAKEIRNATIPVVTDLDAIATPPDIIHGHHHGETMTALLQFPGVPAVYICHDWYHSNAFAPKFPRILRYAAVDSSCHDRLTLESGIPEDRVRLLLNSVDLERFKPRRPLPERPKRALVFSNYAKENEHIKALRETCASRGISLEILGAGVGNISGRPEEMLRNFDIVFAKGRSALEALAVGVAVVIYSGVKYPGPMVTTQELDRLLPLNFGVRAMNSPLAPDALARALDAEISRYDPEDAAEVSRRVRAFSSQDKAVDEMVALYEEIIEEYRSTGGSDIRAEGRAAAAYMRLLLQAEPRTLLLREHLMRVPLIASVAQSLAWRFASRPAD